MCKGTDIKIMCDVVEEVLAKKCEKMGAHALIAVNNNAGGHRGPLKPEVLIPLLRKHVNIPIVSAGGIGTWEGVKSIMNMGCGGLSIGSPFIAAEESAAWKEYKEACVEYGKDDVVTTTKISGTPCTVLNTPYVKEVGTE